MSSRTGSCRPSGAIGASTRAAELARLWLDAPHGWSTGTESTYRSVVGNQVVPALGELRLREVATEVVSRALHAIADRHGPSAAKSSKACLSGMFRLATEDGAVSANPVRDSSTRISVGKKSPRALTLPPALLTGGNVGRRTWRLLDELTSELVKERDPSATV